MYQEYAQGSEYPSNDIVNQSSPRDHRQSIVQDGQKNRVEGGKKGIQRPVVVLQFHHTLKVQVKLASAAREQSTTIDQNVPTSTETFALTK